MDEKIDPSLYSEIVNLTHREGMLVFKIFIL